jgi:Druantia protein DruA
MNYGDEVIIVQCGREFRRWEIKALCSTVQELSKLSRTTLMEAVCEELEWFTATGSYKLDACAKLLDKLESKGIIKLPAKQRSWGKKGGTIHPEAEVITNQPEVVGKLAEFGPVRLEVVTEREEVAEWNTLVSRHHYLGYKNPFGCFLRYFISSSRHGVVGCLLFAGAARSIEKRDKWIGWNVGQRLRNLGWVINNVRFLIMPWVHVEHLASHVLGQLGRRVVDDWEMRWGYRPVLMETFVDPQRYRGTCYKAVGWEYLGETTGKGLARRGRTYHTTAKMILVKPLAADFREQLCCERLVGRVWE